jgi:hypothetical protein
MHISLLFNPGPSLDWVQTPAALHLNPVPSPRAGLDGYGKTRPHWDSIPGPSSP